MKEKAKTSYKHQLVCSKVDNKPTKNPPLLTATCHLCMFKASPPGVNNIVQGLLNMGHVSSSMGNEFSLPIEGHLNQLYHS
jgi:hypothetical protein